MSVQQPLLVARQRVAPPHLGDFVCVGDSDFMGGTRLQHMPMVQSKQPKAQPKAKAKVRISAVAAAAEYRVDFHVGVPRLWCSFYRRMTNHLSLVPVPCPCPCLPFSVVFQPRATDPPPVRPRFAAGDRVSVLFSVEGIEQYCHGTVRAFDEPRRMYRVSYDDGAEHEEMLEFGYPDICSWKRRTAQQDAAATLRAQQLRQQEMQRERAKQVRAQKARENEAVQRRKKTQKANAAALSARVKKRDQMKRAAAAAATVAARELRVAETAQRREVTRLEKEVRKLRLEADEAELDESAIRRKIEEVIASPDFVPLSSTGSETQLQDLHAHSLQLLVGVLRFKIRHSKIEPKVSVHLPLELWESAFSGLLIKRELVTVCKELVAKWVGPADDFDGFFNPTYEAFGMEWRDPFSERWREPIKIDCLLTEHRVLHGQVTLTYCFGTQQLSVKAKHCRLLI